MTRGVCLYLVGSFVLVSLAGCGGGFFQSAEREPWRAEAELACLKSGAVKENAELVRISPISGPGVCGAAYPLKVTALGEFGGSLGFVNDLRPPSDVGNQPRWPISQPRPAPQASPHPTPVQRRSSYAEPSNAPISLAAPGITTQRDEIDLPPGGLQGSQVPAANTAYPGAYSGGSAFPSRERYPAPAPQRPYNVQNLPSPNLSSPSLPSPPLPSPPLPRLGPTQGNSVAAFGPVAMKPAATLACPIVSVLDRWLADSVQPAAMRWFGARVVEIKQISAYSCRGMNGNSRAHISEHAFGNALDIAGFTLADGRHVSVKEGWRGTAEEQGFLRDVQGAACQQFSTVLAPGSNAYHYDHIHVDLMRRASRRTICEPSAMSDAEVAARAGQRNPYASRMPFVTGALGDSKAPPHGRSSNSKVNEEDEFEDE